MRIYVNGNKSKIEEIQKLLEEKNHEVIIKQVNNEGLSKYERNEEAYNNEPNLNNSDLILFLMPNDNDSDIELGMAIAANKKVYLYSEDTSYFDNAENINNYYFHDGVTRVTGNTDMLMFMIDSIK